MHPSTLLRTGFAAGAIFLVAAAAGLGGDRDAGDGSPGQIAPEFAGSESCRACHAEEYEAWAGSTHGTAGGLPGPESVIAPFGGSAIRFADAAVWPRVDDQGRYLFLVEREGRPPMELVVSGVVGRGHMVGGGTQGFVSRFPDGTERFLPFDYSEDADAWFCNTAFVGGFWLPGADRAALRGDAGWLPITEEMHLTACGDWPPVRIMGTSRRFANCQNCHGSQVEVEFRPETGLYRTTMATLQINCESCHGPARAHVDWARGAGQSGGGAGAPADDRAGQPTASPTAAATFGTRLQTLDTLGTDSSLGVCFQCHALKRALNDPADDIPVDYSLGLPAVGDSPYLPDGRIATFGYQQTHRNSACYLFGSMTCVDCHDPHSQGYRDVFGKPLQGRFDDGQCTGCHAAIGAEPEIHTFHPGGSPGAACTSCHMPYIQHPELSDAIPYGRSDHTIAIPRPGVDERLGLASACSRCHGDMTVGELATQVAEWWGEVRPHRAEVAALIAATRPGAARAELDRALVEAAALSERHGLAKVMAVDAWVRGWMAESRAGRDAPPRALDDAAGGALAAMAADADLDVRAVAAAALHAGRGETAEVRALLDRLPRDEAEPERLRARWGAALTQWAAAADRTSGSEAGLYFLRRAQEVRPDSPETLVALGAGLAAAGEVEDAVQIYLESLRRRPDDPVALVNLGLGLESLGRSDEAETVYERATLVRPTEALAHLNLGNARFRRGDLEGAIDAYRAAIANDFGLSRAHFYLAVALVNTGRAEEALPSLHDALEFAPADAEIADVLRQVRAMLGLPSP